MDSLTNRLTRRADLAQWNPQWAQPLPFNNNVELQAAISGTQGALCIKFLLCYLYKVTRLAHCAGCTLILRHQWG
jgi:hypothetical protein